jgi:hypothetical protein
MHGAAGRQIFGNVTPLAAGAQNIHDAVDDRAHIHSSFIAAFLGRRDKRLDQCPLRVGQIARIAQVVTVIFCSVLDCPHRQLPLRTAYI